MLILTINYYYDIYILSLYWIELSVRNVLKGRMEQQTIILYLIGNLLT